MRPKKIEDAPLTDLSIPAFERILRGKLKGLFDSKTIADIEYIEKSETREPTCFIVRIVFGEQGHLELEITSQRKVGKYKTFQAEPEIGRWAGTAFAKYVEDCIEAQTQPTRGRERHEDARLLRQGREALDTGGRHRW